MGKYIFFLFFVDFGIHGIYSKDIKDEYIFITNTTSTYKDIPKDCKLVGAEFDQDYPPESIHLNITGDGPFWIGATIGFKRNINPIGTKECPEGKDDISLDKCNHQCQSYEYFNQGKTSCNCDKNNETDDTLLNTERCDKEDKVLCKQQVCVGYRRVFHEEYYVCGTYRYVVVPTVFWLYKPESCFEKRNLSFICTGGSTIMNYTSSMLSWYEAYQRCKDDGQDLLQNANKNDVEKYKDGRTYWVSLFRRTHISWGTADGKSLCVAACVSNGTLSLVSKLCSDDLPALCYSNQNDGDKTTQMYVIVIVGVGCGVVIAAVVAFVCVKYNRVRKLNEIEDIIRKQHALDKKTSIIGSMKENEAAVERGCSAYSLAGAYSDPINNEPAGKENEGEGYDQVIYQQQHTSDKENIYDHMSNLI